MTAATEPPRPSEPESFAGRLLRIVDDGALALLLSIGHRTGLFEVMAERRPSTAPQIAQAAGLGERYVDKWLRSMAAAKIVTHDPATGSYDLPPEHATHLSGPVPAQNMAALAEFVPLLCAAEDQIVERFQESKHTPYEARPSFRQVISTPAHESDRAVLQTLVDHILPLVPGLVDALHEGIDVLDIGCGSGRAVSLLAAEFPHSRFNGDDPDPQHIERANWSAFQHGLTNVSFHQRDIGALEATEQYDLITDFDAIRAEPLPGHVLKDLLRALRPGGRVLMQEIAATMHLDSGLGVSEDSPLLTASWLVEAKDDGPPMAGVQRLERMLLEAGFESVELHRLPHHVCNCYLVATRGPGPG